MTGITLGNAKEGEDDMKTIKCPYCNRPTTLRYDEFTLTYCEQCGKTYGAERYEDHMIIYTVQEAYRLGIE